ncbi:MAG: hypothetical protein AAF573_21610 [Bacteroidota bacterium]
MSEFWKKIKGIFQSAEESSSIKPTIHEVIERSEEEIADYEHWKSTLSSRRMIDWLYNEYITYLTSPSNVDRSIDFLNTPSSKGFVIHFSQTKYRLDEITHLFDLFKEKVKRLPYRSYVSDTRSYPKNNYVETIHRHYLKPSLKLKVAGNKAGQAFGNINIELLLRNDKVINLKFSATTYRDHLFHEAEDFDELMREVLQ